MQLAVAEERGSTRPCAVAITGRMNLPPAITDGTVVEMTGFPRFIVNIYTSEPAAATKLALRNPNKVWLIDLETQEVDALGKVEARWLGPEDQYRQLLQPLRETRLAVHVLRRGGGVGIIEIWNTENKQMDTCYKAGGREVIERAVELDDQELIFAIRHNKPKKLRIWNYQNGQSRDTEFVLEPGWQLLTAFDRDHLLLAHYSDERWRLQIYNHTRNTAIRTIDCGGGLDAIRAQRMGPRMVAVCQETHGNHPALLTNSLSVAGEWKGADRREATGDLSTSVSGFHLLRSGNDRLSVIDMRTDRCLVQLAQAPSPTRRIFCMSDDNQLALYGDNGITQWKLLDEEVQKRDERGVEIPAMDPLFRTQGNALIRSFTLHAEEDRAVNFLRLLNLPEPEAIAEQLLSAMGSTKWRDQAVAQRDVLLWLFDRYPAQMQVAILQWALEHTDQVTPRHLELMFNCTTNVTLARIPFLLARLCHEAAIAADKEPIRRAVFHGLHRTAKSHVLDDDCMANFKELTRAAVQCSLLRQWEADKLDSAANTSKIANSAPFKRLEEQVRQLQRAVDVNRRNIQLVGESVAKLYDAFAKKERREAIFGVIKVICFFGGGAIVNVAEKLIGLAQIEEVVALIPEGDFKLELPTIAETAGEYAKDKAFKDLTFNRTKFEQLLRENKDLLEGMGEIQPAGGRSAAQVTAEEEAAAIIAPAMAQLDERISAANTSQSPFSAAVQRAFGSGFGFSITRAAGLLTITVEKAGGTPQLVESDLTQLVSLLGQEVGECDERVLRRQGMRLIIESRDQDLDQIQARLTAESHEAESCRIC